MIGAVLLSLVISIAVSVGFVHFWRLPVYVVYVAPFGWAERIVGVARSERAARRFAARVLADAGDEATFRVEREAVRNG